ncbi:MAG: bifunctional DNA-formamidopyrimidine glycosylase/DNA-(apurinic or apyrimidinic site) lyase [Gemmatimonadota bacterium]
MPELPETETIARDLDELVRGARISGVVVPKRDVLREHDAGTFDQILAGATVQRVWRRAKLIVLDTARDPSHSVDWRVVVQPRFTGGLLIDDGSVADAERAYVAVTFSLDDGRSVHYRDVRRLGTVALMSPERWTEYEGALGVEPLDPSLGAAELSALLRSSRLAVKAFLMDQRRLAGIGNIYANEALWRSGIDPSREARDLSEADAAALLVALQEVLRASILARGTSFRDYRDARGERGGFVAQLAAYGRAGEPCLRCGRRLVGTHAIDGRSTVFCPTCQR